MSRCALDDWRMSSVGERAASFVRWEDAEVDRWQFDLSTIAGETGAEKYSATMKRNRLGTAVASFLATPISLPGLNVQTPTAIGALNPFRLVEQPATIGAKSLAKLLRMAAANGLQQHGVHRGLGVGLDGVISSQQVQQWIERYAVMKTPSHVFAELLWYHLSDEDFSVLRNTGDVTSPPAISNLRQLASTADDARAACARHGVAVSWLNAAISHEMAFALGMTSCGVGYWDIALASWNATLCDDPFWTYLSQRTRAAGVTDKYANKLRHATPVLLACLLLCFARAYGQNGEDVALHRILAALRNSSLPEELTGDAASAAVRASYY